MKILYQDCVGAIDRRLILTKVKIENQGTFYNRKEFISQNILVDCSFDMQFKYIRNTKEFISQNFNNLIV